jgi:uncharacterized protein
MYMKVVCDQMLGSLATWLRFLGIDTFYATDQLHDDELLKRASDEQRVLITRDKELIIRAEKRSLQVISITSIDLDEQLSQVLSKISYDPNAILTRCSLCNRHLDSIDKKDILGRVPKKIYESHHEFWICPKCERIYWKGSHYDKIMKKIKSLSE